MNESAGIFSNGDRRYPIASADKFLAFHRDNPEVYDRLRDLSLQLRRRGRAVYGIKSLFEVLRWKMAIETTDEDFKLNNNYTSFYARLLMWSEPELRNFFRLREQRLPFGGGQGTLL